MRKNLIITGDFKLLLTNYFPFFLIYYYYHNFNSVGFVRFACFEFLFSSRDGVCGG